MITWIQTKFLPVNDDSTHVCRSQRLDWVRQLFEVKGLEINDKFHISLGD